MPEGLHIASAIRDFLRRFVVLDADYLTAGVLWVLHTWAFEAARATPYLVVLSATKQSGKTRLLEVLELLVHEPFKADDFSTAVLFRLIERDRPTLLWDECDAVFGSHVERTEPLRGLLNAGNRPGGKVVRCVPPNWDPAIFSVYCPKVLAGIDTGRWPDTLLDRSVVLRMKRRRPDETVNDFFPSDLEPEVVILRERMSAWTEECHDVLTRSRPERLIGLSDRAFEFWSALFAIADLLGSPWAEDARAAALRLFHRQETMEDSPGVVLLHDLRGVFDAEGKPKLSSRLICERLRALPEARWASWGARRGSAGLDPGDLARLLKPFEIQSRTVRLKPTHERGSTAQGYDRADFEDVWSRHLRDDEPPAADVTA